MFDPRKYKYLNAKSIAVINTMITDAEARAKGLEPLSLVITDPAEYWMLLNMQIDAGLVNVASAFVAAELRGEKGIVFYCEPKIKQPYSKAYADIYGGRVTNFIKQPTNPEI